MNTNVQDEHSPQSRQNHRVAVTRHGGPEVLQMVAEDLPEPSSGEVRVIPFSLLTVVGLMLVPDDKQARMSPNLVEFAAEHRAWYRKTLAELLDSVAAGRIDLVVAERIPLTEALAPTS